MYPYLCIVFFIVLDLRLTRLGYSGIPFFVPFCEVVEIRNGVFPYSSPFEEVSFAPFSLFLSCCTSRSLFVKNPFGLEPKSAVLVEFFAVLVENSKRLADFHLSGGDFSGGMADSGRRLETKRKWGGSGVAKHIVCFYVVCGHLSGCFSGRISYFCPVCKAVAERHHRVCRWQTSV